jgi:pyridoxine/pyridoxamine 5'-phosphate oxidase
MPEAMTLATATADGVPSARMAIARNLKRGAGLFPPTVTAARVELAAKAGERE